MKKILVSMMTIALVSALIGGGVYAAFSDSETASTNSFAAGTLDLTIEDGNVNYNMFSVSEAAPGDSGNGSATLENIGNVEGNLSVSTGVVTNAESTGSTEYEADGAPGELGAELDIAIWLDVNDSGGAYEAGTDVGLKSDGTTYSTGALQYDALDEYASEDWLDCYTNMGEDDVLEFHVEWQIENTVGNTIQGDSASVGFTFILDQPIV